jgi:hypothetical protein
MTTGRGITAVGQHWDFEGRSFAAAPILLVGDPSVFDVTDHLTRSWTHAKTPRRPGRSHSVFQWIQTYAADQDARYHAPLYESLLLTSR